MSCPRKIPAVCSRARTVLIARLYLELVGDRVSWSVSSPMCGCAGAADGSDSCSPRLSCRHNKSSNLIDVAHVGLPAVEVYREIQKMLVGEVVAVVQFAVIHVHVARAACCASSYRCRWRRPRCRNGTACCSNSCFCPSSACRSGRCRPSWWHGASRRTRKQVVAHAVVALVMVFVEFRLQKLLLAAALARVGTVAVAHVGIEIYQRAAIIDVENCCWHRRANCRPPVLNRNSPVCGLLSTMLMMPAEPSAENFADGLSMTSMWSMLSAGNCCRISSRLSLVRPPALPLIHTSTLVLPRSEMLPSLSTSTDGMFSSTSDAASPELVISWLTSYDLRSTSSFIADFMPVTVTSFSVWASSVRYKGIVHRLVLSEMTKLRVRFLYPTNVSVSVYCPFSSPWMMNFRPRRSAPFTSVVAPLRVIFTFTESQCLVTVLIQNFSLDNTLCGCRRHIHQQHQKKDYKSSHNDY